MSDDFRTQVYNTLRLKETDELLEIWERNDRVERSELAFEVIREILEERLVEIPAQDEPVYKHVKQDADDETDDIPPEEKSAYDFEESGVKIEFEGFYGKETLRKKAALVKKPKLSQEQMIWRVGIFISLIALLILSSWYIIQSQQYFSRIALTPVFILGLLYWLFLRPYIEPHFETKSSVSNSKFYKGFISSQGIRFTSSDKLTNIPWGKIYRAKKTQDLIVLFAEYISPMAFPCNFFKSEADWQQFRNWVDYYMKSKEKTA